MRRHRLVAAAYVVTAMSASRAAFSQPVHAVTDTIEVTAASPVPAAPGHEVLEPVTLAGRDAGSLMEAGPLLPSVQTIVNSRGEGHFLIRGAPERHVQVYFDDIPLNVAWDERVDLETIPLAPGLRLETTRGLTTLLDGPGALAGGVRILADPRDGADRSQVDLVAGEGGLARVGAQHGRRAGRWDLRAAATWNHREQQPLARGVDDSLGVEHRFNSDLDQFALLMRAERPLASRGRWSLLAVAWTAEKGVPPELHLGDDARFWRYPVQERALLGTSLRTPLDRDGRWLVSAVVAADALEQEIDPRGPDGWGTPASEGQDYEKDSDRTGTTRLRLDHWLTGSARLTVLGCARYAHHRESLVVGGPTLAYAQWLNGVAAEAEWHLDHHWTVNLGAGQDYTATPEAGDKTANEPAAAPCLNFRATRRFSSGAEIYGSLSRRSRFPSLRELYSGALGRFTANPDLGPERLDQVECGAVLQGASWSLESAAFLHRLTDGIERIVLPDDTFQRVNRQEIRVPGAEASLTWTPIQPLTVTLQHTVLAARVIQDGAESPAEDRPDWLSHAWVEGCLATIWTARLEIQATGARWSADPNAPEGLTRLPAGVQWGLRLACRPGGPDGRWQGHLRLDNLADQRVDYQTGLPAPGRLVSGGLSLTM